MRDIRDLTLSGLRRNIAAGGVFGLTDLVPLPCNPDQICIGYGVRSGASVVPVTRLMNREDIVSVAPNTITFERDPALRARIFDLLDPLRERARLSGLCGKARRFSVAHHGRTLDARQVAEGGMKLRCFCCRCRR